MKIGDKATAKEGMISAVYADRVGVHAEGEEVTCWVRGRFKGQVKPVVGDRVRWEPQEEGVGNIIDMLPRTNALRRSQADRKRAHRASEAQVLAANVELLVAVAAVRQPPLRPGLLDRILVAGACAGIPTAICITKRDLDDTGAFAETASTYQPLGIPVVGTRTDTGNGLEELARLLQGKVGMLVGHSGVGKTSLINQLEGQRHATQSVGFHKDRGRHTTTTARLIPLRDGGFIIDSPGVREFGLHGIEALELATHYPDFAPHLDGCGFRDCLHREEPRCAVRAAMDAGEIGEGRYRNYLKLVEELL